MPGEAALVVDDNSLNLELFSFLLEADGFVVSTAANADAAMRAMEHSIPALLVIDVQLPGMNGLELTSRLRSNSRYATTCIVVATSYAMDSDREAAFQSGCDGYLSKPIETRSFAARIRTFLTEHRTRTGSGLPKA